MSVAKSSRNNNDNTQMPAARPGTSRVPTLFSSSLLSRSSTCVPVTYLPSRPPSGESLGPNVMASVGGSIGCVGSGSLTSGAATVSATPAVSPATHTMSPAAASGISSFSMPRWQSSLVTRPSAVTAPGLNPPAMPSPRDRALTVSPTLTLPVWILPMHSRPT